MTREIFLSAVGMGASKGGIFVVSLLLAGLLGTADFAKFGLFYLLLSSVTGTLGNALFVSANRYGGNAVDRVALFFLGLLVGVVTAIITSIYGHYFLTAETSEFRNTLQLAILGAVAFQLILGFCYANGRQHRAAILNILASLVLVFGAAFSVVIGLTVFLFVYAASFWLAALVGVYLMRRDAIKEDSTGRYLSRAREILLLAILPLSIAAFFLSPVFGHFATLLSALPDGDAQVALFSVASQLRLAINLVPVILTAAYLSRLTSGVLEYRDDWDFNLAACLGAVSIIMMMTAPILWYLNLPLDSVNVLVIVTIASGTFFAAAKGPIQRRLLVRERIWFSVASNGLFGVLFVGSVLCFDVFDVLSVSYGFLIAQCTHFVLLLLVFHYLGDFELGFLDRKFALSLLLLACLAYATWKGQWQVQAVLVLMSLVFLEFSRRRLGSREVVND